LEDQLSQTVIIRVLSAFIDAIQDAYAWAGDQLNQLFDVASGWLEQAGIWSEQIFGFNGIELAGSFLAGMLDVGQAVYDFIGEIPSYIASAYDAISNLTVSDVLDGIQGILDVVGFIPGIGEIADGINGVISLARGDYVGAALSFTSMIPIVGDAIGKGGKAARFIANKVDDVVATGKWIKCKVTGTGCFVAGTKVWVSATADNTSAVGLKRISSLVSSHEEQTEFVQTALMQPIIEKQSIESVAIGSRVTGENPRPWEYDDEFSEPDASTWSLARFSLQKEDGSWIDVEMIRPSWYWEQQGAIPGSYVFIEFPELEASGFALVHAIEPCPVIASGTGQVVTARILTRQVSQLVELTLEDGSTLAGTPQHPIWSVERQDWVELGELEVGEHLWTKGGPIEISSTRLLGTGESVYKLEVHGHHIYQVTGLGVLVHNAGIHSYNLGVSLAGGNIAKRNRITSRGYQAAHIVPNPGWKIARGKRTQELLDDLAKAREKLRKAGIDLDGKQNGFWAKPGHKGTHSADNLRKIADRINNSTDVAAALKSLKKDIISGKL
jgi:hypothetical protein